VHLVDVAVLTETRLRLLPGVIQIFLGFLGLLFLELNISYGFFSNLFESLVLRIVAVLACESSCRRRICHSLISFNGWRDCICKLKGELVDTIVMSTTFDHSHGLVALLS
jgi:hypothetical protein